MDDLEGPQGDKERGKNWGAVKNEIAAMKGFPLGRLDINVNVG
jgi:hypothetical protein